MKDIIILDPHPRTVALLFNRDRLARLRRLGKLVSHDGEKMPAELVDASLAAAVAVIGQTDLPTERLERATRLRAIVNVEGNFLQNIDYATCFERGIHVLGGGVAFAQAVAEMSLGFALDLARGISEADRKFREGREVYGRPSNAASFLLKGKRVGLIGYGNLGRALVPLLRPFGCELFAYDPWLPPSVLREAGLEAMQLREVLRSCRVIFVLAGATSENGAMLSRTELSLIQPDSVFVLASRASLVDFDALTELLKAGRFSAAIDVFPEEPFPGKHALRGLPNVVLSAHRAGGLLETYDLMGEMIVDDLELILSGLPPARLQRAHRETSQRMQSKPVG
jgi:phosphoglycerate dehydrogenase-like enzyme